MGALPGLLQVVDGPAGDDLLLKLDVFLKHFFQGQGLRLAVYNGQHNHAEGGLHLGIGIKLV